MQRWMKRVEACAVVCSLACVLLFACDVPTDPNDPQTPEEVVNPDKPNSNGRIVTQTVVGKSDKRTSLWEIADDRVNGCCFRGLYNSYYTVGRIEGAGGIPSFYRTAYSPRDVRALHEGSPIPGAILTVGNSDTDGDSHSDIAYLSLVSPAGSLLDEQVLSADTADVALISMAYVADSTYLAVGSHVEGAELHPFVVRFVVTSDGKIERKDQAVITGLSNGYFIYAETDHVAPAGPEWSFFAATLSEGNTYYIHKITVSWPSLAASSVAWGREATATGVSKPSIASLRFRDGNLYWVGTGDDPAKDPPPDNGEYWSSAVAGSITAGGQVRWATVVRATGHGEMFSQCVVTPGALYAVGRFGEYQQNGQTLGYGWIYRMSTDDGAVVSSMVLGNQAYSSGFNDGMLEGTTLSCAGWTREEVDGTYQGWFCKVSLAAPLLESPALAIAPVGGLPKAAPGDRTVEPDRGRSLP